MIIRALLDILFPPLCHLCRAPIPGAEELHLCPACLARAKPIGSPLCTVCGVPFATEGGIDHRCGDCIVSPPPYEGARAAYLFEGPVQELVHRFKYGHRTHLRRPLALLAAERLTSFVAEAAPDLIIPVPLHRSRLRERGFNQAILMGELLARQWRIPLHRATLGRVRATPPQVGLTSAQRRENIRGAFAVPSPAALAGRRVLLLDDVFTTGSTIAECALVLRKAGAAAVHAATVARTP
ncbi:MULTISPECIES: ComF family protein [Geobacter]|uniref:Competence protein ComF n=2 Tax=Geobacter TaxID=28231 RepID=A0A0C1QRU7_9BACT|nr:MULTISPECIES: ComF family protein [Geobacter]ANA41458.1 competence protein ComF [Geobacter anodireducens]KIE43647.1 competence protein ComF [Geobacter soli]MBE2888514.1 ComF family protein [Geobacter anodireducens]HMN01621.1 ComF family protein [Geobacter anodireducens]